VALRDLLIVISELVSNAVTHGEGRVVLQVFAGEDRLRGSVVDESRAIAPGRFDADLARLPLDHHTSAWGVRSDASTFAWFEIGPVGEPSGVDGPTSSR
jgi:anti-sigma regulatory factor (Ser/Thr protein kinase)